MTIPGRPTHLPNLPHSPIESAAPLRADHAVPTEIALEPMSAPNPRRRMSPFRKTSEGLVITKGTLTFFATLLAVAASLVTGAAGAMRWYIGVSQAPTRQEFAAHVLQDSTTHAKQFAHDAFQDSLLAEDSRNTHAMICFVYKNPRPFCDDRRSPVAP